MRVALFLSGALLLTLVIHEQVTGGRRLVPAWGVEGMTLVGVLLDAAARRVSAGRRLRLARLGYDIRSLDALGRIISFVVLGSAAGGVVDVDEVQGIR